MNSFAERLRAEIEYSGMLQKEVAFKAGIKKRALDMYIGAQESMPPADVAVKLAQVLNVSVEYLVTGQNSSQKKQFSTNIRKITEALNFLDDYDLESVKNLVESMKKRY